MKKRVQSFNSWKNTRTNENVSIDAESMRAWMLLESYHWSPVNNNKTKTLGDLFMLGKKSNLLDTLILKETVLNENVRLITEDEELLDAFKLQITYEFLNEGIGSFFNGLARTVFGDELVDRAEKAWDDFSGSINKVALQIINKGKDLWDKTVDSLKSLVKNITSIAKKIGETIKKFLSYIWEGITNNAGKVGKVLIGQAGSKIKELGNVINGETNEGEENSSKDLDELRKASKKASFAKEVTQLGTDFVQMTKRYFTGEEAPGGNSTVAKVEDSGKKLIDATDKVSDELKSNESLSIQLSMDNIILESLKGLCTIATDEDLEKIKSYESYDFGSDIKLFESDEHHEKSAVVGWLSELAKWVLSPVGNLIEFLAGAGIKLVAIVPSALANGWKNRSHFTIIPVASALIAGIAYKVSKISSHFSEGGHEAEPAEISTSDVVTAGAIGGATMVAGVNMAVSSGMTEEAAKKVGQLMVGGLIGALMTIVLAMFPTVAFIFKMIMTSLLIAMTYGFLAEAFPKTFGEYIPDYFVKFYHAMH